MRILCLCGKAIGYEVARLLLASDHTVRFVVNSYEETGHWYKTPRELGIEEIPFGEAITFNPELIIVAFYDNLLDERLINLPKLGAWNLHLGDPEKYRGAYPNIWALMNGDSSYSVTLHRIDTGIDTGSILAKRTFEVPSDFSGEDLYVTMVSEAKELFCESFSDLVSGAALSNLRKQSDENAVTRYRRDLFHELSPPEAFKNAVRALTFPPFPPPFFMINNRRFVVIEEEGGSTSTPASCCPGGQVSRQEEPLVRQAKETDIGEVRSFIESQWSERAPYQFPYRWSWLFRENPFLDSKDGLPVWIAVDRQKVVGLTAAMVVPMKLGEKMVKGAWSINTVLAVGYRGQGLGYRLQKANQEQWPVFMSLSMTAPNRRVKLNLGGEEGLCVDNFMLRLGFGEKAVADVVERKLAAKGFRVVTARRIGGMVRKPIAGILSWLTKLARLGRGKKFGVSFVSKFGLIIEIDRFTSLMEASLERLQARYAINIHRSVKYLNWKFVDQPHMQYRILVAGHNDKLSGYIIFRTGRPPREKNFGLIADILADDDAMPNLISAAVEQFQMQRVDYICASSSCPRIKSALADFGFKRTSQTVPMFHSNLETLRDKITDLAPALLSRGDHDWDTFPSRL